MEGSLPTRSTWGLVPFVVEECLFRLSAATEASATKRFLLTLTYLEVYNEEVYDLLRPDGGRPLKARPGGGGCGSGGGGAVHD